MNSMRQSMRPKHQVLVLKCYPKFQKGVSEVKPNPSELSYLLYYASTRRSKVQKVVTYLERKSSKDVPKGKLGNVQVTLHIIRALIDKSPRDLPLYAPYVLRILSQILQSKDLSMVEESVPAFQALCEHEDTTTLSADPERSKQFEDVVKGYAILAHKPPVQSKTPMSAPVSIRWKTAGLQAIKSIASSEAIGMDGGRQLHIIVPVILENLYSDGEDRLIAFNQKLQGEKETAMKRRMSINTVRTAESTVDAEKAMVTDTAADADRIAEEEAGLIALQSLRQVFVANNRSQIRLATACLLSFLIDKAVPDRPDTAVTTQSTRPGNWTTTLIEMVTNWTPVQDRFIIIITTVENLVKSPMTEENLEKQLVLATLAEWLLSSSINMIGLSIMDVLLGLIQHILALLQLGGQVTAALPPHEQPEAIDLFKTGNDPGNRSSVMDILNSASVDETRPPSLARQQLLNRLRKCVGSLATHVYYSDQINDMVTAILLRLKPSTGTTVEGTAAAIEKPAAAAQQISESANIKAGSSDRNEFFSFGTARVTALNAIKDVLVVANRKGSGTGAGIIGRNRISIRTWQGTQWLLRDEDRRVRRAYVEALMTWLRLELLKQDFRIPSEPSKIPKRKTIEFSTADQDSRTVAPSNSSASRTKRSKSSKSTFLQLLHLAVYEDALELPEDDENILLLHLLLHSLITKLGVNAVRTGLPMIRRLQEDINVSRAIGTPKAKINIGSLVHGYLKSCVEAFDFDTTMPGFEIENEVTRRMKHGLWLKHVQVPPQNLDMIISTASSKSESIPMEKAQKESLRPFDNIKSMVEQIALAYSSHIASPPASPPTSPGRLSTMPKISTPGIHSSTTELPVEFKEAMVADWSRESCIAAAQQESARSTSPNGSRSGTTRSQPNGADRVGFLVANGNNHIRDVSPASAAIARGAPEDIKATPAMAAALRRRSSAQASSPGTPTSRASSEHAGPTLHIDDLKRVLAGGAASDILSTSSRPRSAVRTESPLRHMSKTVYQDFGGSAGRGRGAIGAAAAGNAGDAQGSGLAGDRHSLARRSHRGPSMLSAGSESIVDAEGFESASEGDPEHDSPEFRPNPPTEEVAEQYVVQLGRRPFEGDSSVRKDLREDYKDHGRERSSDRNSATERSPVSPLESGSRPTTRGSARPRSSSEASAEDPEANARALKGQLVSEIVRGSIVGDDGVPPVPPLPTNLRASNRLSSNPPTSSRTEERVGREQRRFEEPTPTFPHANGHARNISESLSLTALPPVVGEGGGDGLKDVKEDKEGEREDTAQAITDRQIGAARKILGEKPAKADGPSTKADGDGAAVASNNASLGVGGGSGGVAAASGGSSDARVIGGTDGTTTTTTAATTALPANKVATPPRSVAGSQGGESTGLGSVTGSLGRRSVKGNLKGADGRLVVQALLGSIEVGDVGGKGIGRPPV